ncbi:MAG TPA: hypothetical protein VHK69_10735 [Chitinophagaceae bacterium]|jgi:hypothetical protein|nr:hypothetical protein [Chitinophagaceae bacterium]
MDKKEIPLQEQDAPLKNGDDAFVQVSEDGSPRFPEQDSAQDESAEERTTDLDKR